MTPTASTIDRVLGMADKTARECGSSRDRVLAIWLCRAVDGMTPGFQRMQPGEPGREPKRRVDAIDDPTTGETQ